MNKLLAKVKAKFDTTNAEDRRVRNAMDKLIKKYLFLFQGNIYTNSMKFNYRHKHYSIEDGWFANITYHPNSLLSISTGTYYLYQGSYHKAKFDKPPDINKVINAFKKTMEGHTENTKGDISRMRDSMNLIEQLDNANLV